MFDDLDQANIPAADNQPKEAGTGIQQGAVNSGQPMDIFAPIEVSDKPEQFQPADKSSQPGEGSISKAGAIKKIAVAAGLIAAFALFFAGLWWGYAVLFKNKETPMDETSDLTEKKTDEAATPEIEEENPENSEPYNSPAEIIESATSTNQASDAAATTSADELGNEATSTEEVPLADEGNISQTVSPDSDFDGLSDNEEAAAGTDPAKKDTDFDGLLDYEELKKYLTDPLVADSDNDGYSDGQEVSGGYNPKGAGKLEALDEAGALEAN